MEKIAENITKPPAGEEKTSQDTESSSQLEVLSNVLNVAKERSSDGTYLSFYQGFWCPTTAINGAVAFQRHFQAHDTDIILASFPKSGTTWLKALAFTIVNRTKHPLSQSPLLSANPHECVPSLELQIYMSKDPSAELEAFPMPRILSTHMPYATLPSTINTKVSECKIVYICRNPMDQLISYWLFGAKLWSKNNYSISLDEIFSKFCSGICWFGPFWDHVLGYWKASQERPDKVLFFKYEDLKEDTVFHTKLLAEFLGFPFSDEEVREGVVEQVSSLCSFDHLKDLQVNKSGKCGPNHANKDFFRKATVGDWSNYLSRPMADYMEKLIQEKFEGSGLTFKCRTNF